MKINKAGNIFGGLFDNSKQSFQNHVPELKKNMPKKQKEKDMSWMDLNKKQQKSNNNSTILSAGKGGQDFSKSGSKFLGSQTNNSIWNNEKLNTLEKGNDQKIKEQKKSIQKTRLGLKKDRLDSMISDISKAPISVKKSIFGQSTKDASSLNKYIAKNENSIFDKNPFQRLQEKTAGQKLKQSQKKEKDQSWKKITSSKQRNGTDFFSNLININK